MKKEFIKALDKITDKIIKMDIEEFSELMLEHKDGKYAKILRESGAVLFKGEINYNCFLSSDNLNGK